MNSSSQSTTIDFNDADRTPCEEPDFLTPIHEDLLKDIVTESEAKDLPHSKS